MTIDRRIIKKIFAILMTATLVYGAFFSVAMEIAYAEEVAKNEATKVEAPKEADKSEKSSSSNESTSKGDTSESNTAAEKGEGSSEGDNEEGVGNEGIGDGSGNEGDDPDKTNPDDQQKEQTGDQKDEQNEGEPPTPSAEGDKPAVGNGDNKLNKADDSTDDTHKVLPDDGEAAKEKTVEVDPDRAYRELYRLDHMNKSSVLYIYENRDHTNYTIEDSPGQFRVRGFFHKFDEGSSGIETMTIAVDFGFLKRTYYITRYSDGHRSGILPGEFAIEGNDLVIRLIWPNAINIEVIDYSVISAISEGPDGSYYEPEYEPVTPVEQHRNHHANNTGVASVEQIQSTPSNPSIASGVSAATKTITPITEATIDKDVATVNAVLSSYQKTSNSAIMDATNDDESPINATTAMLAGVGAMFMITLSLVVIPKV